MSNFERDLKDLLEASARRLEVEFKGDSHRLREVAAEEMAALSLLVGQPGFEEAVLASRDIVLLESGLAAVELADAADAELRGLIGGFLAASARALA